MKQPPIVELRKEYLFIKAFGDRSSFKEIMDGTLDVYNSAIKNSAARVFADYSEVRFKVPITQAFNILRFYESNLPEFQDISMSVIINSADSEIAKYWESICNKRGFNVAVFKDVKQAEEWLKKQ